MLISYRFIAVAVVACLFAATAEAQSLSGQWRVDSGTLHGKNVPASVLSSMSLVMTDSTFTASSQTLTSTGAFKADSNVNPLQVVFTIDGGADSGRELKAIYQFQGRNLQIVYSGNDQFPNSFQSTDINRYLVLNYTQGQPTGTSGAGVANSQPQGGLPGRNGAQNSGGAGVAGPDQ